MAYVKKIWKDYPDATTPILAEDMNNIEDGIENIETGISNGWVSADETWTYSSVDDPTGVITISGDKTTKYSLGMRIKFTNGGNTIYGIITKLSYSNPNTTMTFLHEIDPTDSLALHLMANSAITNNYYSSMKVPFGFPLEVEKWTLYVKKTVISSESTPTKNTWYNVGSTSIDIPIGNWCVNYKAQPFAKGTTSIYVLARVTLSTANNSQSDIDLTSSIGMDAGSATLAVYNKVSMQAKITLTTKTTYYFNASMDCSGTTVELALQNNIGPLLIEAVCAYL